MGSVELTLQAMQTLFTLILVCLPYFITTQCILEPDTKNVVSTQLEGSWAKNEELNDILANGHTYFDFVRFTKIDSLIDLIPEWACSYLAEKGSKVYMTGELSFTESNEDEDGYKIFMLTSLSETLLFGIIILNMMTVNPSM